MWRLKANDMKIETQLNIGDKVWAISNNKPRELNVNRIDWIQFRPAFNGCYIAMRFMGRWIGVDPTVTQRRTSISYQAGYFLNEKAIRFKEEDIGCTVFLTREGLIKGLFGYIKETQ